MTKEEVIARLRADVERYGSQAAWAKKHGVTRALVSAVLKGKREPGELILKPLGLREVGRLYKEVEPDA